MATEYRLQDLIDIPRHQALLDCLYVSSGIPSAIIDLEGTVLTWSGGADLCNKFHRCHPATLRDCIQSDVSIAAGTASQGVQTQITCPRGLTDTATPLIIEGRHLANVFTGQVFLEPPDREFFRRQAAQFGFDETEYLKALDQAPLITQKQLDEYLAFMAQLTEQLAQQGLTRLRSTKTQEMLRESESNFRAFFESIGDLIVVCSPDGHIRFTNEAVSRTLGYSEAELATMQILDLRPPDSHAQVREYREAMLRGEREHCPLPLLRKDGEQVPVETRVRQGTWNGAECLFVVSKNLTAEVEARQRFERLFRRNPNLMALTALPGKAFFDVNDTFLESLGYAKDEILGKTPGELKLFPDVARQAAVARELEDSGSFSDVELQVRRKDGTVLDGIFSGEVIVHQGRTFLLTAMTDITDRKRLEEAGRSLQHQLMQSQKLESLGTLAGGVAHDMNNVLGAILGLASASIEAQPLDSPTRRTLETIVTAAERGGKMVKSLLTFARQSPAAEEELDMNALLQEEVRLLERTTLAKVQLVTDLAPDLRPVRGDSSALTHALMNLCVNAVEAMPENGTLTLRTRNVEGDLIEIRVEDTGRGMTPEVLAKAMDPFFTTKEVGKGTGLGLPIVHSTVTAHKGSIDIQSEAGLGTRVTVRLPACAATLRRQRPESELHSSARAETLTILVVDDDELVQGMMKAVLTSMGHQVTLAPRGEAALTLLEAGYRPDVVILDMNMPGLGGAGTLRGLRSLCPMVPVLLATGRADQAALGMVEADAHVTLLSKPFSIRQMREQIAAALAHGAR